MIERVVYTSEAAHELGDAYAWYEARSFGLGEDFFRCIEACISGIRRHPEMYPVAVDEYRRALVRRFPFEIFYEATVDELVIHAVFHCSRDPEKWRSRLKP